MYIYKNSTEKQIYFNNRNHPFRPTREGKKYSKCTKPEEIENSQEKKNLLKLSAEKHKERILSPDSEIPTKYSQDFDVHPFKMIRRFEFQIIWIAYFCFLFCINPFANLWKVATFTFCFFSIVIFIRIYFNSELKEFWTPQIFLFSGSPRSGERAG